jgi:hypothetical protein
LLSSLALLSSLIELRTLSPALDILLKILCGVMALNTIVIKIMSIENYDCKYIPLK